MPQNPTIIYGQVTYNGDLQIGKTVMLENLTRGGTGYCITESDGSYVFDDLAQLTGGFVSGDSIKVIYLSTEAVNSVTLGDIVLVNVSALDGIVLPDWAVGYKLAHALSSSLHGAYRRRGG